MNNKQIDVFITGKPCSLKDTAAGYISTEFGLTHIRVSSLIRKEFEMLYGINSEQIQDINNGEIKSTKPITLMLNKHVEEGLMREHPEINVLYDGYPRTLEQWDYHHKCSIKRKNSIKILLFMYVSDEESIRRALKRLVCSDCKRSQHSETEKILNQCIFCCSLNINRRVDDNEKTMKRRLAVYKEMTSSLENVQTDKKKNIYVHHIDTENIKDIKKHLYNIIINYYGNKNYGV